MVEPLTLALLAGAAFFIFTKQKSGVDVMTEIKKVSKGLGGQILVPPSPPPTTDRLGGIKGRAPDLARFTNPIPRPGAVLQVKGRGGF